MRIKGDPKKKPVGYLESISYKTKNLGSLYNINYSYFSLKTMSQFLLSSKSTSGKSKKACAMARGNSAKVVFDDGNRME